MPTTAACTPDTFVFDGERRLVYRGQLDDILTYIDKLNEVDTSGVEPMAQVLVASTNDSSLRDDVVVRADVITEVLAGAPDPEAPYFRVPRVIEK